jgi:DNA-binding transcriptional ArsR family regulator
LTIHKFFDSYYNNPSCFKNQMTYCYGVEVTISFCPTSELSTTAILVFDKYDKARIYSYAISTSPIFPVFLDNNLFWDSNPIIKWKIQFACNTLDYVWTKGKLNLLVNNKELVGRTSISIEDALKEFTIGNLSLNTYDNDGSYSEYKWWEFEILDKRIYSLIQKYKDAISSPQQKVILDFIGKIQLTTPLFIATNLNISSQTVSGQLSILKKGGYIKNHEIGKQSIYQILDADLLDYYRYIRYLNLIEINSTTMWIFHK